MQIVINDSQPVKIDNPVKVEVIYKNLSTRSAKVLPLQYCDDGVYFFYKEASDTIWSSIGTNRLTTHIPCGSRMPKKSVQSTDEELICCMLKPNTRYTLRVIGFKEKGERAVINAQYPKKSKGCKVFFKDVDFVTEALSGPDLLAYQWIKDNAFDCNMIYSGEAIFDNMQMQKIKNFRILYPTTKFEPHAKVLIIKDIVIKANRNISVTKEELYEAKKYCQSLHYPESPVNVSTIYAYLQNINSILKERY